MGGDDAVRVTAQRRYPSANKIQTGKLQGHLTDALDRFDNVIEMFVKNCCQNPATGSQWRTGSQKALVGRPLVFRVTLLQSWYCRKIEMIARKATALIAAFALGSSSCATLIYGSGTQQTVSISTQPPGATIEVGDQQAVSPAEVVLDRYTIHSIVATKPGYEMATATIGPTYSWATVLDLAFVLPFVVDVVSNGVYTLGPESNAVWTLSPNTVNFVLTPVPMPQVTAPK